VEVGQAAASAYGAQVRYVHGTLETIDVTGFDAFYLFNPFGENLYDPREQLDTAVELSAVRWMHDLSIVEHWLDNAAVGTCMVTYHGFGGRIPATFQLLRTVRKDSDHLRLWQKRSADRSDSFFLEVDGAIVESRDTPIPD
jgi:hypothetical protein